MKLAIVTAAALLLASLTHAAAAAAPALGELMPLAAPYDNAIDAQLEHEMLAHLHTSVFDASVTQLAHTDYIDSDNYDDDKQQGFDLYVLAQSWQPEFCRGKESVYPGCRAPLPFWRNHFTLHGLWPERERGAPPGFCSDEPFDAVQIQDAIGLDVLMTYWPDVKFSDGAPHYPDFWNHEWTRHGTCSGLKQVAYFAHTVNLVRNGTATTPAFVQQNIGQSVELAALRDAFTVHDSVGSGDSAAPSVTAVLKCVSGDTLSQVFTCWSKDSANAPVARRACPDHVLHEDTCSRAKIHIPAFA